MVIMQTVKEAARDTFRHAALGFSRSLLGGRTLDLRKQGNDKKLASSHSVFIITITADVSVEDRKVQNGCIGFKKGGKGRKMHCLTSFIYPPIIRVR